MKGKPSYISAILIAVVTLFISSMPGMAVGPDVAPTIPGQYIVLLADGVDPSNVAADHGVAARHSYRAALKGFVGVVPANRLAALQSDPRVRLVEPERLEQIGDQPTPTGVDRIETDKNPKADIDKIDDVRVNYHVAIIDTGIDGAHPDLSVAGGSNFTGGPSSAWGDGNGHGSHVSGTVGALDNGIGVVGVAPGSRLWAVKVCGSNGFCTTGDMVAGIDWVAARKADAKIGSAGGINFAVANMSISTQDENTPCNSLSGAVHQAICGLVNQGVVFSLAAGNEGRVKYAYPEVLAVAAIADFDGKAGGVAAPTCRSDGDDTLANFSNYGSEVDIAAPGTCITSTWLGGGYNTISGTSMAAPHVAGAVALYLHANGLVPATNGAGVDAIEAAILSAAIPQGTSNHQCSYNNERGSNEPLLFVNAVAFGGDGTCDVAGLPPPVTTGSVAGTVTNVSNSTPISGASVSVDSGQSATTAADGTYTIANVPTGTRTVIAAASGFNSQTKTATVTQNLTTTVNFALTPVSTATTVKVNSVTYVTQGGKNNDRHLLVTVALVNNLGNPVSGASVAIDLFRNSSKIASVTGTTGADGKVTFTLKNASSGCYTTNVTSVAAAGLTWDGVTPANNFCK
ncbi:MAG: peptidase and subtilisin kexin sedolisin [Dehalococcoidia bacterium]|nr:peptidase and subtilisin kexin sedolisin [Dehalococcoidia bacterium]